MSTSETITRADLTNILNEVLPIAQGALVEHINVATNIDAYKIGSVVAVHFTGANTTSTSARTVYGTLPVGWRPPQIAICGIISGNTGYGDVDTNGKVEAFRSTIGRVDATVTYIATQ